MGTHPRVTHPGHQSESRTGPAEGIGGLRAPASRGALSVRADGFGRAAAATGVALPDQGRTAVTDTIAARDRSPIPAEGEAGRVPAYLQGWDSGLVAAASPDATGGA